MTAPLTDGGACAGAHAGPTAGLDIDYRTFEAFNRGALAREAPPRILRWFDCLARAGTNSE